VHAGLRIACDGTDAGQVAFTATHAGLVVLHFGVRSLSLFPSLSLSLFARN
jgi:hypothetical protein